VNRDRIEGNKAYGYKSDRETERKGGGGVEERARNDVRSKLHNKAINTEGM
jgi:hypothetical protein